LRVAPPAPPRVAQNGKTCFAPRCFGTTVAEQLGTAVPGLPALNY
jgi:hypothetical protein